VFVTAGGRAGGRAVSEPYYSQRARSVCVSLSAFFILVSDMQKLVFELTSLFREIIITSNSPTVKRHSSSLKVVSFSS